ncbi:MAG: hypothetical protein KDA96_00225 [Planctomycetaceae bacterium]|nr:hypothetical protein [Planctomycetaceae bacterium]
MAFFRVTQNLVADISRANIARQTAKLFDVQQQVSTGLRIQRPSDDPTGLRRALIQEDRIARLESHATAIRHVQSRLNSAYVQLQDVTHGIVRARDIALSAPQITTEAERMVLARELDGLLEQIGSAANAADESGYLFAGTAADSMPFPDFRAAAARTSYEGSDQKIGVYLTGEAVRDSLLPGDQIFQPLQREPKVILGQTQIKSGASVDTAFGTRTLTVAHATTTYAAGSGVAAGVSSAQSDTIIGPPGGHTLIIDDISGTGASGTVRLNGGPPIPFTSADTDLEVTGRNGEVVFIDTTAITPGFSGSVDITADGTLSIDGGASVTPIDFTSNQAVVDSSDGGIAWLDTTSVTKTQTAQLEFPGTNDLFGAIRALRDDILNTRNLSSSDQNEALNRRLGELERFNDHILDIVGMESVSSEQMQRLGDRTTDLKLEAETQHSDNVSADITAAVLHLQEMYNLQQFTLSSVSRLVDTNLLNYLR